MNKNYILVFLMIVMAACNTDVGNFQIGEDLVETKSRIVMIDSFSVKLSTVLLDSIATYSADPALVGKYENETIGTTELRHYFNFDLSETSGSLTDKDILDSVTIKLSYSGYYYGDTTQVQKLQIHQLTKELAFFKNDVGQTSLVNHNSFDYETEPIGSLEFYPFPSTDSIEIRLDDSFGQELIDLFLAKSDDVSTNDKFNSYLKGFIMKAAPESKAVIGFNTSSSGIQLKLYTHRVELEKVEIEYDFELASEGTHFNQSLADRTGTDYASLFSQREELPATQTSNLSYIQGSEAVVTRIDFPALNEIYTYGDRVLIKAELVLVPSTLNDPKKLPTALNFYTSDRINQLRENLAITSSSGTSVSVAANLVEDVMYPENNYYIADISTWMQTELANNFYDTNNGLLITFPFSSLRNSSDLLILNGENSSKYKPKLNLYFLKYE
ncbi:DUF4270 family protein [Gaoshiqia sediminis]|uniref:DUF4270 domain-containing protein n=1 Tax=Gaoshiqia sediminis TaxID=2986998 RepID=A0AA42C968_9BACT|nr:DUF4270 family protein [Gaoshiqia sediminis]MCW0482117.1 DUF4270 domain-containing protein [Gaoshiqia sediminis]